jgi:Immunity protein Imm1
MALRVTTREDRPPVTVEHGSQLDEVLLAASEEARTGKILGAVLIEADNGDAMTMVVGGDETVLSFDYGHQNSPYYASKGASNEDDPIMTCYLTFQHHTEIPRKYVIPFADGVKAVRQFLDSGGLPTCINWEEV